MGMFHRKDDLRVPDLRIGYIFTKGLERDSGAIQVKCTGFTGEFFQDGTDTTCAVDVFHVPFTGRDDFAEVGSTGSHLVYALQGILYARFSRKSGRVPNTVV